MQAFRAAATIDEERQLHLSAVPFSPGTAVDVIVLERSGQTDAPAAGNQRQRMRLAEEQYRLAEQYPDEYVVLVGERIVHHGADRQQAARAYQRVAVESPSNRPVIVSPGEKPRKPLLVRGRALTGKYPDTR